MPCNCCEITDNVFSEEEARAQARDYRRRGPAKQTSLILAAVRSLGLKDVELLDIGGGIGAIYHELLQDVARKATHVDASSAYLSEARAEVARRGHAERVEFIHADFTDIAAQVPEADIVTLDRVVCCYPNFRALLQGAARCSRRALAFTYPRETWYLRIAIQIMNLFLRLSRNPFRVFLHPVAGMEAVLNAEGLERVSGQSLFVWEMSLYRRVGA